MDDKFDCIIVGGGIAGLSAALTLAKANMRFLLIERGEFSGAKNVSGGVLWGNDLNRLVPNYWEEEDAGFERFIKHRRLTFADHESSFSLDFKSAHYEKPPYAGLVVLRSKFDNWLAGKVEEAIAASDFPEESFIATNILVEEVIKENGKVVGIRAGEEQFFADCVIIAEGVNNLLTRQIGLQDDYVPADYMATGIKEVIRFDQKVLEDRFQLKELGGMSNEFVGASITNGIEGGGFLYTNRDSVSIGLVLSIKDMREKLKKSGKSIYDVLNDFKKHPVVAEMIEGGEIVEYSAHVVSMGDMRVMPKEIYADGVMLTGEAANLLMNSGKAIQGMDYAMHSGILAAETVVEAKKAGDFSANTMKNYRAKLENSYVLKDLKNLQGAVHLLHDKTLMNDVPNLVCDFAKQFFTIKNEPTEPTRKLLSRSINKHSSYMDLLKIGLKGAKAL
ncbi:FAD-dependent oxidoreductase [bacterium]|nr:MAG: FAD-dependent oxidoreductase [bacterium]